MNFRAQLNQILCIRSNPSLIPLLPVITKNINLSLSEAIMPEDFKNANLLPHVKNVQLNVEILKSFHCNI